jgi:CBS domain-containing protein
MLEPSMKTHFALSVLGVHDIDAMTIWFGKNIDWTKRYVVYGYSSILTLLRTAPKDYGLLMEQPCEAVAVEPATISENADLENLLDLFFKRRFGFAYVERAGGAQLGGFANLRDLVALYEKSVIKSDLRVGDVASYPIVTMPGESNLKDVLDKMVRKNVRRVLVSGTQNSMVSDRDIVSFISSTYRQEEFRQDASRLLDAKLQDLKSVRPASVELELPVDQAAKIVYQNGGCLICGEGIVTPWDIVIKPWIQKKLLID